MKYRELGSTGMKISEVSFGAWAIGAGWGTVDDKESLAALHKAVDLGINFIDTADVYGTGRSEKLIAQLRKERSEQMYVATKAGRKLDPHVAEKYTPKNIRGFIQESLKNLQVDTLDLLQLHCPPTAVYYTPELFDALDGMVREGLLRNYGVSVEKVEEALKAIEFPGVKTVQIIFNMFRQRPAELFFREAKARKIGIIIRVPLASGLLTGKMTRDTRFENDDHRNYNREGASFDKGETFAGVNYEKGLQAVEELKSIKPAEFTMAQFALKWILMHDAVSCTIPGAKRPAQVEDNCRASDLPGLSAQVMDGVRRIYEKHVKTDVHQLW
ncbi:MAG: aldo/keto reductase [Spirochaetaceae bacterium]|nr:MAG: aldo/keto reductase [Spirochaetaceae bacterium]